MREIREVTLCSWCGDPVDNGVEYHGETICGNCFASHLRDWHLVRKLWKGVKRGRLGKKV